MEIILSVINFNASPRIGGISPHGVGIAVGYLVAGSLMVRHAARRGISADDVWNMLMRAVVGVIVGARLFYVMGHPGEFFGAGNNWIDIFKIYQGGIVFYGGVFGGIVAAYPYMRKHNLSFKAVLDSAAPAFPLGLIFGRIGDIIVGDHLGGASTLPFAFRFHPYDSTVAAQKPGEYVAHAFGPDEGGIEALRACFDSGCHQTALYDLWNVLVLLPVVLWLARKPRPPGFLIAFTATWYGGARLFTDIARDAKYYLGLHGTQWASIVLIMLGTWYMVRLARGYKPAVAAPDLAADTTTEPSQVVVGSGPAESGAASVRTAGSSDAVAAPDPPADIPPPDASASDAAVPDPVPDVSVPDASAPDAGTPDPPERA